MSDERRPDPRDAAGNAAPDEAHGRVDVDPGAPRRPAGGAQPAGADVLPPQPGAEPDPGLPENEAPLPRS